MLEKFKLYMEHQLRKFSNSILVFLGMKSKARLSCLQLAEVLIITAVKDGCDRLTLTLTTDGVVTEFEKNHQIYLGKDTRILPKRSFPDLEASFRHITNISGMPDLYRGEMTVAVSKFPNKTIKLTILQYPPSIIVDFTPCENQ